MTHLSSIPGPAIVVIALTMFSSWPVSGRAPEECPLVCTANPSGSSGGIDIGPGSSDFNVIFGTKTDGHGLENPCAACPGSPCKQEVAIVFSQNSTNWCLRYSYGPLGTSAPLPSFSRAGYMSAGCDDHETLGWDIVDCTTGASSGATGTRTLACDCPS